MAFALKFDGVDDRVDLPSYSTTGFGPGFGYVEMEVLFSPPAVAPTSADKIFGNTSGSSSSQSEGTFLLEYSTTNSGWVFIATALATGRTIFPAFTADNPDSIYKFRVYYASGAQTMTLYLSIDGGTETEIGSATGIGEQVFDTNTAISLGWMALGAYGEFVLHGFNLDVSGNDVRTYDPSASGGTGQILTDTTSGQNATLSAGFPDDDSQWISTVSGPTITDIDGDESVYPGQSYIIQATDDIGATQGTVFWERLDGTDDVQHTVTNWDAATDQITVTAVRGGHNYGSGLYQARVVLGDGTTEILFDNAGAGLTLEAEPGTFAVTAASPNTTDPASLWSGLVDTATGDPVTVVDGDQAWVKTLLDGLAIDPTGAISANETGSFTVQFWRASEGVWGSYQTVSFTLPAEATDNWPFGKAINPIATKNWTWGSRHPMTGMRVRIFK